MDRLGIRLAACALATTLLIALSGGSATAVTPLVVRPGALQSWIPYDGGTNNGRWVTGPATPPLGLGSAQLKASTGDALEFDYSSFPDLSTFVAKYQTYGSTPAEFGLLTDADLGPNAFQVLFATPPAGTGWQGYDATAGTWSWDCNGDGNPDGSGTIADFLSGCNNTAKVQAVAMFAGGGTTYVDDVELGPSGTTTVYDMEPPLITITDAKKLEGDTGKSAMRFKVKLSGLDDDPVHVKFTTANGTAIAGKDYVAKSGTLAIPAGVPSAPIKVWILGDTKKEPNETFKVKLSAPTNGLFGDHLGVGTIVNDD